MCQLLARRPHSNSSQQSSSNMLPEKPSSTTRCAERQAASQMVQHTYACMQLDATLTSFLTRISTRRTATPSLPSCSTGLGFSLAQLATSLSTSTLSCSPT